VSNASIGRAGPARADLTPTQARAVAHPGGPLLVLGGAGSGKTTVLAARFARLVADGTAAESILALSP
jgi:DNA helicase-2/ATP-dependent DNA helicase PcrA